MFFEDRKVELPGDMCNSKKSCISKFNIDKILFLFVRVITAPINNSGIPSVENVNLLSNTFPCSVLSKNSRKSQPSSSSKTSKFPRKAPPLEAPPLTHPPTHTVHL